MSKTFVLGSLVLAINLILSSSPAMAEEPSRVPGLCLMQHSSDSGGIGPLECVDLALEARFHTIPLGRAVFVSLYTDGDEAYIGILYQSVAPSRILASKAYPSRKHTLGEALRDFWEVAGLLK